MMLITLFHPTDHITVIIITLTTKQKIQQKIHKNNKIITKTAKQKLQKQQLQNATTSSLPVGDAVVRVPGIRGRRGGRRLVPGDGRGRGIVTRGLPRHEVESSAPDDVEDEARGGLQHVHRLQERGRERKGRVKWAVLMRGRGEGLVNRGKEKRWLIV